MLKKIVLEIDGKKIELTPEQAKTLHGELEELFGEKAIRYIREVQDVSPWRPYPVIWGTTTNTSSWSTDDGCYTISV